MLVSSSLCESLSAWTAVQGEWRGKTQSRHEISYVISHASQCEVQSTTRMLARFNSETFKPGWTQAFWALVPNRQSMLKNTEYQPTLNIQNIQLLHQCIVVPVLRLQLQENAFPPKTSLPFFFLLVGLKFISSRVNCACQHCKFYPLPLSTNTSFLSSFTALQTCGCSMVRKFILLQQVVKGLHKESWANTTFFTAMFKMAITSYCFCSSFCVGLER